MELWGSNSFPWSRKWSRQGSGFCRLQRSGCWKGSGFWWVYAKIQYFFSRKGRNIEYGNRTQGTVLYCWCREKQYHTTAAWFDQRHLWSRWIAEWCIPESDLVFQRQRHHKERGSQAVRIRFTADSYTDGRGIFGHSQFWCGYTIWRLHDKEWLGKNLRYHCSLLLYCWWSWQTKCQLYEESQ